MDHRTADTDHTATHLAHAIAELAHELRNATSTVWTGTRLLTDAQPDEAVEIARDLLAPAELLLLFVDLFAEAARSCSRPVELEPVKLAPAVARAATRAGRGGLTLETEGAADEPALTSSGSLERLLCAAATSVGATHAIARIEGTQITLSAVDASFPLHERAVSAGWLLAQALAVPAGAVVTEAGDDGHRAVTVTFAPALTRD